MMRAREALRAQDVAQEVAERYQEHGDLVHERCLKYPGDPALAEGPTRDEFAKRIMQMAAEQEDAEHATRRKVGIGIPGAVFLTVFAGVTAIVQKQTMMARESNADTFDGNANISAWDGGPLAEAGVVYYWGARLGSVVRANLTAPFYAQSDTSIPLESSAWAGVTLGF